MNYTLIERVCKCGCGEKFKVLPTSQSFYAASSHDPDRSIWMKKEPKERYKENIISFLDSLDALDDDES